MRANSDKPCGETLFKMTKAQFRVEYKGTISRYISSPPIHVVRRDRHFARLVCITG